MSRGPTPGRRFQIGWLVLLVVAGIVGLLMRPDPLARRLDAIRARGEPVSMDDLARMFPAGPEESRQRLLDAVGQVRNAFTGYDTVDLPGLGNLRAVDWGADELASWDAAQPVLSPALEELRAALDERSMPLGIPSDLLTNRAPRSAAAFLDAALVFRLNAHAALARDLERAALDSVHWQIRLASQMPTYSCLSWRVAVMLIETELFTALEELLGSTRLGGDEWRKLRLALTPIGNPFPDPMTLMGERAESLLTWDENSQSHRRWTTIGTVPASAAASAIIHHLHRLSGGTRRDLVRYLDFMEGAIQAAALSGRERTAAEQALLTRQPKGMWWGFGKTMLDSYLESMNQRLDQMARHRSRAALFRLATGIAEYRSRTGHPPSTLAELEALPGDPVALTDPVSELPIRFLPGPDGYRLVAAGRNAVDEDGSADDLVLDIRWMPPRGGGP